MLDRKFGLLGETLAHSYSPLIHGMLGNYKYRLYAVERGDAFHSFMEARDFDGINVTIPYKQAVIPYCAVLSDEAAEIGSVNTIVRASDRKLHGYNTDYFGFCDMLARAGIDPKNRKCVVLGDGGSARTVRAALRALGGGETITVSRHGSNNYSNIEIHYDAEIIVNTTPVGMYPNNGNSPLDIQGEGAVRSLLERFLKLTAVVDLIYNPFKSKLCLDAARLGIPCIGGFSMLVAQAVAASELFKAEACGDISVESENPPIIIDEILRALMSTTQNISLIGMPGCGKTTVGRELANMLGRPFVDLDAYIADDAGMGIPDIIARDGEGAFRQLETRALREVSKLSRVVVATGGGIVTQAENLDLLRQNGVIVYLRYTGDINCLNTDGRPISAAIGVEALARTRLPLYESWSDFTVSVAADPRVTAKSVLTALEDGR